VQPGGRELVEEPEGERGHVLRVRLVDLVERGQVPHAGLAHVVEQRRVAAVPQVALEEDALAQARLRGLELGEAARGHRRADDRRAGEDEVRARGLDAGDLARSSARARRGGR
jgi:hypothetical protein